MRMADDVVTLDGWRDAAVVLVLAGLVLIYAPFYAARVAISSLRGPRDRSCRAHSEGKRGRCTHGPDCTGAP